jgi:hypothetical protein
MRVAAILLARALAFVETTELNSRGQVRYTDLVKAIVDKFNFIKFPIKLEDFDETKGVEFIGGKFGDTNVDKLTIFTNGLFLDTRKSTAESERILHEGLTWASSSLGLNYNAKMVKRTGYLSNLNFYSDCPFLLRSHAISNLTERVHEKVGRHLNDKTPWEPTIMTIGSETIPRKTTVAPFTIQRIADTPFSENKYYSEAPLQTEEHIELLESFEADVLASEK